MQTPFEIGFGRADITPPSRGMGMMGFGQIGNIAHSAQTPLWARAMFVHDGRGAVVIVVADLCFISKSIHRAVMAELATSHATLGLSEQNVVLTAQHTHSGPGGYSESPFYNATIPGFWPEVLQAIVAGIVASIAAAAAAAVPSELRYGEAAFELDADVAFNRRLAAYARNHDVTSTDDPRLALDRTMRALWATPVATAADGQVSGVFSWFAVHATSIHSDNTALHFDNKGYAAQLAEAELGGVAAFAQGAAGDVTPNNWRHPRVPLARGKFADDDQSARYNGSLQGAKAIEIVRRGGAPVVGAIASAYQEIDMACATADADLADGQSRHTAPGEIGMAMFLGTEEGPGLPLWLLPAQRALIKLRRLGNRDEADVQAPKITWLEATRGRLLGIGQTSRLPRLPLPARVQRVVSEIRDLEHKNAAPWTPHVLPVQLVVIGNVAIAAAPGEFTTVAGRRVRQVVGRELQALGVTHVIFAGYANNYAGYVTTPEEYEAQAYEGASTHLGKWTLPAYLTAFRQLARKIANQPISRREIRDMHAAQ
ncbi:MAG: neutral/alkaline non-lysosomal ceramidase N-terminal domain-containing protein [Myxococcales bacterium]|nr:neutral/alkaline non-lysosomal ceramidase N-terminal domain-containing protein [Myxococcales bacterium]